jgi:hypothetical protein
VDTLLFYRRARLVQLSQQLVADVEDPVLGQVMGRTVDTAGVMVLGVAFATLKQDLQYAMRKRGVCHTMDLAATLILRLLRTQLWHAFVRANALDAGIMQILLW